MNDEATTTRSNVSAILITGVVSLAVGVCSGLLIKKLTEKRPKLTYDVTTQEVFPGQENNIGIFALRISNDGQQEIEQVLCHLEFSEGEITERSVAGIPESARIVGGSSREIEITVPFLNPGEQFAVHVLLANVTPPLTQPSIEVRGKGVVGSAAELDARSPTRFAEVASVAIAALATVLTTFFLLVRRRGTRVFESLGPREYHDDDQRDTVAFVLETNDLLEDAQVIREWPRKLTYWAASDALSSRWLASADVEKIKKGLGALRLLLDYVRMADRSRRIVLLNATRLALAIEDRDLAGKYLASAREGKDGVIQKRLNADPSLASWIAADGG